ncbi:hypothetical protein U8D42_08790 [Mycobacterium europaeum]|uniref:Uncharacterized protein n=1 Tax=Mycobacterium europaeum TaxID=761804 RepID=A0A0U1DH70_9MYCO|nr:hypothetical protein [Mycobacterium europaeum]MEA1162692.1 hypothetical protein [Mycobacterium europaeum]ORV64352.1 hypothetical protein AWC03_04065 [Mycobacterium europaeum]CQD16479.1 hypothetical protein BN000_03491 [Mycobacterium europaeum]
MKAQIKTAAAVFGGMSAVALAVGFGAVGIDPAGGAPAAATHPSSSTAATSTTGAGTHVATLAGCVSGLDC